tara:strand:+ start:10522 stop:10989 length:468 start_codon:yes stop_codon:yes gene_type:complete
MKLFNENIVRVHRTHDRAKLPTRAHTTDAGMDFFYCPRDESCITLGPGESSLFQTGIKMEVPPGHMLQIMNKSGIASKRSLLVGACVVDEGYTGEIFVNLHNVGTKPQTVEPGQKVAQGVFVVISKPSFAEITEDNIYGSETTRGSGALGSTGDV